MFRKINTRTLLILFGVLLGIFILSQIFEKRKGERTFRSELAEFDTAKVTQLIITDSKPGGKSIELIQNNGSWKVKSNGKEFPADKERIIATLGEILSLKAERVAATSKERWKEFEVTDSTALLVLVKSKNKVLSHLMVGKFSWQPSNNPYDRQGKLTSFVRLAGENEVYAVNGFLRMNLSPEMDGFRDKTLINTNQENISNLSFIYPSDSSYVLEKQKDEWIINGIRADSAKIAQYLSTLSSLRGFEFYDVPAGALVAPVYKLTLKQNNGKTIEVAAFPADSTHKFSITSSENPGNIFSGQSGLAEKIFIGKTSLLK